MNRLFPSAVVSIVASLFAVGAYSTDAKAQVVYYPTAEYMAAYTPYYYNGYAHYLYRNNWYYRDQGGWHGYGGYGREPEALYNQRGAWGGREGGHMWGGGHGYGGHGYGGHGYGGHGYGGHRR